MIIIESDVRSFLLAAGKRELVVYKIREGSC